MLAWLGLLVCLVSASSIHHDEDGVHLLHACQLCSLEEITAHGASILSCVTPVIETGVIAPDDVVLTEESIVSYDKTDIRGPPLVA